MRIRKSEKEAMIQILMQNHRISKIEAEEMMEKMNGDLDALALKIRKRQRQQRNQKATNFSEHFAQFKSI